jgi:hypothetical protein
MGGFKNRLAFVPACKVSAVPVVPDQDDSVDALDLVTASGSFVFISAGDKPVPIYATDKSVSYQAENQGEIDGRSFLITASFVHPGSKLEVAAFSRMVNNTPGYVVVENTNGDQYIIGQPGLPASIAPAFAGGQARTDRKGTTFTVTADSFYPYAKLETPIDLDELFEDAENPAPQA